MTKFKAFADKLNVAKILISVFGKAESIVGKGKKWWLLAFSSFPTIFSKGFFLMVVLAAPRNMSFKNIVGRGENAGYKHYSFPQNVFYPFLKKKKFLNFTTRVFANALNLDQSKILLFGKGLT